MRGETQIFKLLWPAMEAPDLVLQQSVEYLFEACHTFRLRLKNIMTPKSKGKGDKIERPNFATIYVAKIFPEWQGKVISILQELYREYNSNLPDNSVINKKLLTHEDLKKRKNKPMSFVEARKKLVLTQGERALSQTAPFDEVHVLTGNLDYLKSTLNLMQIEIKSSDEGDEKIREECCPMEPIIVYERKQSVLLELRNPQPHSALFSTTIPVFEGEILCDLINRLKLTQNIDG